MAGGSWIGRGTRRRCFVLGVVLLTALVPAVRGDEAEYDPRRFEITALASGDLAALYTMGVHPLLLAPYSRFMAIPRPKYQSALDPLRGLRVLRS